MLTLARVYLRADVPRVGQKALPKLAESIRKSTRSVSRKFFRRHGVRTGEVVRAREGSVEIVVVVTTLTLFIRHPYRIKEDLDQILENVRAAGRAIRSIIMKQTEVERDKIEESRVTTGHPGRLEGLRKRVAQRRMTVKDAHQKAVELFERADVKVSKPVSDGLLEFFKDAAGGSIESWTPKKGPARPGTSFFGRGVRLERRPGEEKVSSRPSPLV